jgi:hypothetical protein
MVALAAALLVGLLRIAVEYITQDFTAPMIDLDRSRIGELRSSIDQDKS